VLIAGAKLGVTPLDIKLRRGTKVAPLLVHLEGYSDFASKVDLADGYTNNAIELVKPPPPVKTVAPPVTPPITSPPTAAVTSMPATTPPPPPPPSDSSEPDKTSAHGTTHSVKTTTPTHSTTGTKATTTHASTPPLPAKPKCQPQNAMNPFDTSCDGHACPPCPN
jgi:hypothetical protein